MVGILGLLLAGIHNLFSPKGLAALASFALLNLFFAFRFYRRSRKLLGRVIAKILQSLNVELRKVWEAKLDSILDSLQETRGDWISPPGTDLKRLGETVRRIDADLATRLLTVFPEGPDHKFSPR